MARALVSNGGTTIFIPKELALKAKLTDGKTYEADIVDGNIVIDTLPEGECCWCGSKDGLIDVYGNKLCKSCQCRALWVISDQEGGLK